MNENRLEQTMGFSTTPINLYKKMNKKSRKTHRSISDESVQKRTSLNRNCMDMRDRPDTMTRNPKEHIIELNKLMSSNPRNGSTSEK